MSGAPDETSPGSPLPPSPPGDGLSPSPPGRRRRPPSSAHRRQVLLQTGLLIGVLVVVAVVLKVTGDKDPSRAVDSPAILVTPSASPSPTTPPPTVQPTPSPSVHATPTPSRKAVPKRPTVREMDKRQALLGKERLSKADRTTTQFVVGAHNVLGASHTRGKEGRKGYRGAEQRLPAQIDLLNSHQITVAGVQEFQASQAQQFRTRTGGQWDQYPGPEAGLAVENSLVWRRDTWELVRARTVSVPYFGGATRAMPYVLLRHRSSERQVWFGSFHNPADVHGPAGHHRARAVQIEAELAASLATDGTPVVFTGDMNDRTEFICPFSRASGGMHSPDGSRVVDGACRTAPQMSVDWIVGSSDIAFSEYRQDWSSKDRRLSDHPVIVTTATIAGRGSEPGCRPEKTRKGTFVYCPRARTDQ